MTRLNEPRSKPPERTGWLVTLMVVFGIALFTGVAIGVTAFVTSLTEGDSHGRQWQIRNAEDH